ncbi:MAG: GNAT family N-acetyltransferase, partial [Candidatus Nanohaloarchaea archaeon]|nr:GNAT family N-acetyltransferase [Candidatus Nanohaloarchaea archaeon]
IMRDIPSTEIDDGASRTNARQLLNERMDEKGLETREIRGREAGHRKQKDGVEPEQAELVAREYDASGGTEQFLSFEDVDRDILLGYLRLRFSGGSMRPEIDEDTAIVRQLQVVGPAVPLNDESGDVQHSGYGKRLMEAAEERAREEGFEKLAVISAVGTREYYRKLGYERDGPYMSKRL